MPSCLIGLGSNLGNRRETLDAAIAQLAEHPQITLRGTSPWHETAAIGGPAGQSSFLNGAALLETSLAPQALLSVLQRLEADLGRQRIQRWGPRTLDLDLLLYDRLVLDTPSLVLPHPRMAWRRFVLEPAAHVAGSMVHPTTGWSVSRLLEHLDTTADYVAIAGSIAADKSQLAQRLVHAASAELIADPLDPARQDAFCTDPLDPAQLDAFYADPPSQTWEIALEFLRQRSRLLAADLPRWAARGRWAVSDFWFDQSVAFARAWLPPDRFEAFLAIWEQSRAEVVRPKLTVLLDVPIDRLPDEAAATQPYCRRRLTEQQLERMGQALLAQTREPDAGPVLRLAGNDPEQQLDEVLAAMRSTE